MIFATLYFMKFTHIDINLKNVPLEPLTSISTFDCFSDGVLRIEISSSVSNFYRWKVYIQFMFFYLFQTKHRV